MQSVYGHDSPEPPISDMALYGPCPVCGKALYAAANLIPMGDGGDGVITMIMCRDDHSDGPMVVDVT